MGYMIIDPGQKFHCFAPVPGNDGIIQNQNFDPLWPGQGTESSRDFGSKQQNELLPVERDFIQETIIGIF